MPVQLYYELTDVGASVLGLLDVLADWAVEHGDEVVRQRVNYRDPQS
jgi:DNA-binding HxlR family transcriptional regulator